MYIYICIPTLLKLMMQQNFQIIKYNLEYSVINLKIIEINEIYLHSNMYRENLFKIMILTFHW